MWYQARRAGFPGRHMAVCVLGMALGGLLGGRLNAWIFHLGDGFSWPNLNPVAVRSGGTGFGAVVGVLAVAALYAGWRHWDVGRLLDTAVPIVLVGEALQRIGCLLNGSIMSTVGVA